MKFHRVHIQSYSPVSPPPRLRQAITRDKSPHMKPLWSVRGCQNNIFIAPKDLGNHCCLPLCWIIAEHPVWTQRIGFFSLLDVYSIDWTFLGATTSLSLKPMVPLVECEGWVEVGDHSTLQTSLLMLHHIRFWGFGSPKSLLINWI